MKLYWGLNSIPELQGLPTIQQRQLWRASHRAAFGKIRVWGSYALILVLVILAVMLPALLRMYTPGTIVGTLWAVVCSVLGVFTANQLVIPVVRPALALQRVALESKTPPDDGSYYVPPAF